ncbi:hypothetical protein Fcan01_05501 [Folsomia candida]|uniref:EamA domain-containing protein n=1 Tax=Folsomia candida TaxID=158441 RepID=A0A226ESP0_FOLCA|nr:hypothetical protein Fcan01_05501 [Folsomia candida]
MVSDGEDHCSEDTKFIRRPTKPGGRLPRPRSASQIISNPKLVKSLQNLDIAPRLGLIRPASCVNIRVEDSGRRFQEEFELQKSQQSGGGSLVRGVCQKYLGIILALFASLVFSLSSIIVKAISENYHPYTLSLWTFQGLFLPSFVVLLFQCGFGKNPVCHRILPLRAKGNFLNFSLVVFRAFCGAGGTVLKVYSLQYMTAADSTVIAFSSPVFVVIVAWMCLDEKCGVVPIVTAVAVLIGCSLATGCMLLSVFTVVILRYIRDVHYAVIAFFYGLIGTMVSLGLCVWEDELKAPETIQHWFYAVGVAFLTFVGQNALTLALQYEQAGPISLIRPSEILFIFVWQFLFLNKIADWPSLVGALIVFMGVLTITARKWISTLPKANHFRKSCGVLLI